MIIVIGEILFDVYPKAKRLGGAPFNFAYHLKHLGFPVRFISRIGLDDNGGEILDRISIAGFDPNDIQRDDSRPTGTVQVQLDREGIPTFDIVAPVAYDYIEFLPNIHPKVIKRADLLYFGTLAQRADHGFKQIQKFLDHKPPQARAFYDINLRPGCYSKEVILASLHHTDILKLNLDELEACRRIIGSDQKKSLFIREMIAAYSLHTVALTKGGEGSELHTIQAISRSATTPIERAVDTVGAGDAYAAMLAVGILKRWPPKKSLSMASAFASRICTIEGAIPETEEFYAPLRRQIHIGG